MAARVRIEQGATIMPPVRKEPLGRPLIMQDPAMDFGQLVTHRDGFRDATQRVPALEKRDKRPEIGGYGVAEAGQERGAHGP